MRYILLHDASEEGSQERRKEKLLRGIAVFDVFGKWQFRAYCQPWEECPETLDFEAMNSWDG